MEVIMKRKTMAALLILVMVLGTVGCTSGSDSEDKKTDTSEETTSEETLGSVDSDTVIAWYAPAPHSYFDEVKKGVEQFVEDTGMEVIIQIGADWTQASENEKVEALIAQGVNALAIYPCDASGANGLYEEITEKMDVNVVNFGTDTSHPTTASFAVATDVKQAAYDATVALIEMMGEEGNILNVLEVLEDPNTALRKEGVEEAVANYPNVEIIQEIAGIQTQEEAVNKIESALSANLGKIDGMICTGMEATVGMSQILSDYYEKQGDEKHIYAVGIDTDSGVMNAIENGIIDATIAQNSFGHGYISCMLLKYLGEGYQVKGDAYFIDSGNVLVTVDNIDSYEQNLEEVTQDILDRLTTDYLEK